jgi:iron(III) transport system ATP-binding protein
MADVSLRRVVKRFGDSLVVDALDLDTREGEFLTLLGPSGCGKTTTLRMIAGLVQPTSGRVLIGGEDVTHLEPRKRQVGMVFQDYALFPHLTVAANIGFGLHRMQKKERASRVAELLQTVGLADASSRYPHELSGGQQQRVALARALAPRPDLLLMDEPFSNLDVSLRERLSLEIRDILKSQNATAILVTHDQDEAFAIADEIGVMQHGEIQQWDTAYNLYHKPANRFVANFIGQGVFLPGKVLDSHHVEIELGVLKGDVSHKCTTDCHLCREGYPVDVLIRPDDIVHDDASPVQAAVVHKAFRGADILYTLRLPGGSTALSLVPSHHNHAIGEKIGIRLAADHVVAFSQSEP